MSRATSPAVHPPELEGVAHRWVTANGVRLHVAEAGVGNPGPPLVLIHGWPQHWWCWHKVIPLLAQDHHVVAVDLRGHGWSDVPEPGGAAYDKRTLADDVVALIDELGLDRPVVVGHDWGAWVSLLVGGRGPEVVRGVVATAIVAPWAPIPRKDLWRFLYQPVVGGPWGMLAHRVLGQAVLKQIFHRGSHRRGVWTDADMEPYLERYRDRDRAAAGRSMYATFMTREMPTMQRRRYQRPIEDVPVLMLPGRRDIVLAPHLVERGVVRPHISMKVIDGAGHWVPEEQPEALVEHVEAFLTTL